MFKVFSLYVGISNFSLDLKYRRHLHEIIFVLSSFQNLNNVTSPTDVSLLNLNPY